MGDDAGRGRLSRLTSSVRGAVSDAQAASQERGEANLANYGPLVKKGTFGFKTVEIYAGGYARVGLALTARSPFERLRSVKYTQQVQARSGIGHVWASGGLGSRDKRVLLLTIATDDQVHTLSVEGQVGRGEDKLGLALEAAGNGVVQQRDQVPPPPPPPAAAPEATAADKLRQIADLHRDGVLSDEEYADAKARLLGQL